MEQGNGTAERLVKHSRALGADVRELAGDVAEAGRELREKVDLSRAIQEHPFRSLLIAAGVGYVLGGGLFTRLTGHVVRIGTRAMVLPILRSQLDVMLTGTEKPGERH